MSPVIDHSAHNSEQQPGDPLDRVGGVADVFPQATARGLARRFQAIAIDVVEKAVVDAAEAAILDPTVTEIGPAGGAVQSDQPNLILLVASVIALILNPLVTILSASRISRSRQAGGGSLNQSRAGPSRTDGAPQVLVY